MADQHGGMNFDFIEVDGIEGLEAERAAARRTAHRFWVWTATLFVALAAAVGVLFWWPR